MSSSSTRAAFVAAHPDGYGLFVSCLSSHRGACDEEARIACVSLTEIGCLHHELSLHGHRTRGQSQPGDIARVAARVEVFEDSPMSLDQIVAHSQQTIAASLREAFNAGRAEAAVELKGRVHALVEELIGAYTAAVPGAHVEAPLAHDVSAVATEAQTHVHVEAAHVEPVIHDHQHDMAPVQQHEHAHDQGQPQEQWNQGQNNDQWNQGHQG